MIRDILSPFFPLFFLSGQPSRAGPLFRFLSNLVGVPMPKSQAGAFAAASFAFLVSFIAWEAGLIALPFVVITAFVLALIFIA